MGKNKITLLCITCWEIMYLYLIIPYKNMAVETCSNDVHNLSRLVWLLYSSWVLTVRSREPYLTIIAKLVVSKHKRIYKIHINLYLIPFAMSNLFIYFFGGAFNGLLGYVTYILTFYQF